MAALQAGAASVYNGVLRMSLPRMLFARALAMSLSDDHRVGALQKTLCSRSRLSFCPLGR